MNKKVIMILMVLCVTTTTLYPEKKLGQTGFQFLSVGSDARIGGLADAITSLELNSSSLFANPAGMARMNQSIDFTVSQNTWIADILYNAFSFAISPLDGRYGVIGLTLTAVDYGEVQGTMVWSNEQGYIDTDILNPSAFSAGLGYARALTDKFSIGGQVKYVGQQLGRSVVPDGDSLKVKKNLTFTPAFDFGTIYKTGFKSLAFGMSVKNFSGEIEYEKESFELPLTFRIGIAMDVLDFIENITNHSFWVSIDATHPRSYPEQVNVGLEYKYLDLFSARLGYMFVSDEQDIAFGFGLSKFGLTLDYSYAPFGVFDPVQRFTLRFSL